MIYGEGRSFPGTGDWLRGYVTPRRPRHGRDVEHVFSGAALLLVLFGVDLWALWSSGEVILSEIVGSCGFWSFV